MQVKKQQLEWDMEQQTGSKLGKEYIKDVVSPYLFNLYAEYIMQNAGSNQDCRSNINNFRYTDDTTLMAQSEEELKSLLMKLKVESEKVGLKTNILKQRPWHPIPSLHGK